MRGVPYALVTYRVLVICTLAGLACRGPQRALDSEAPMGSSALRQQTESRPEQSDSEARLAPDDAFFAGQYLSLLARYSEKDPNPVWTDATLRSQEDGAIFDFSANFAKERLDLMTRMFVKAADGDGDSVISEAEFTGFRWDSKDSFGTLSQPAAWHYSKEVYQKITGGAASLETDGIRQWLQSMGPLLKKDLERQGEPSYRLSLIRDWERVLAQHDRDRDGQLDVSEQHVLRQERSKLVFQLLRE